jgi:hypothetical protein
MMFSADQCWQILQRTGLFPPVFAFAVAVLAGVTTYLALLWLVYPRSFSLIRGLLSK